MLKEENQMTFYQQIILQILENVIEKIMFIVCCKVSNIEIK